MPETGRVIGTPASIIDKQPPHTVAIDDEPLDSVMSDNIRMVYGKSSVVGNTGRNARHANLPWPISRRPGAPKRPTSPTE